MDSFPVQRLVKCEDGSGIVPPSLRRYKLHCSVDAGWIAGIKVNHFFHFLQLNDVLLIKTTNR